MAATSIPKKAKHEGGKSGAGGPSLLVGMKPPSPKVEPTPKPKPSPAGIMPTRQPQQYNNNNGGNSSQPPPHYGRPSSGQPLHHQHQFGPAGGAAQPPAVPGHELHRQYHPSSMNQVPPQSQRGRLLDSRDPAPRTQAERRTLSHLEAVSAMISKKVREEKRARDEAAAADSFLTVLDEREQKRQASERKRREKAGQTDMVNMTKTDCFLTVYENIETIHEIS